MRDRNLRFASLVLAASLSPLLLPGCGGGGDGGMTPNPVVASFSGSGAASTPNFVRLTGAAAGDTVIVSVKITGPTTSSDLYAFAFDLVLGNASVAQYVAGSVVAGPALVPVAGFDIEALASQQGNRVVVGVAKLGGTSGSGNPIGATEETVVSLTFRVLTPGSTTLTIDGDDAGGDPLCLDSDLNVIGSITFDSGNAILSGS
jgi:hypothetical protein